MKESTNAELISQIPLCGLHHVKHKMVHRAGATFSYIPTDSREAVFAHLLLQEEKSLSLLVMFLIRIRTAGFVHVREDMRV